MQLLLILSRLSNRHIIFLAIDDPGLMFTTPLDQESITLIVPVTQIPDTNPYQC